MRIFSALLLLLHILGATLAIPAQAQVAPPPSDPGNYILGPNDEVRVTFYGIENRVTTTRIAEDGTITLPFLGKLAAAGRTPNSLADDIATRLRVGGIFVKPNVGVDVTEFVSNAITIVGRVGQPGLVPLDRELTVSTAVARAGGAQPSGADFVILTRKGVPGTVEIALDDLQTLGQGANLPMKPGDTLLVPEAPIVYIYGQVNSPGAIQIKRGMTVRQLLARAGGVGLAGSQKKISLYRGETKIKRVGLEDIVQDKDTYYVRERIF